MYNQTNKQKHKSVTVIPPPYTGGEYLHGGITKIEVGPRILLGLYFISTKISFPRGNGSFGQQSLCRIARFLLRVQDLSPLVPVPYLCSDT